MADTHEENVAVYNEPVATTATRRERLVVADEDRDTGRTFPSAVKRVSWGAIFAGAVVAVVTQMLLSLLGLAVGLSTIDPVTEQNPLGGLATGTGIWLAVSTIVAFLLGGYVAARLAGLPRRQDGMWHGIVVWGVVMLFTWYLMTTAVGQILNTTTGILGRGVDFLGNVAPAAAEIVNQQIPQGQIGEALPNNVQNPLQNVTPRDRQQIADRAAATMSSAALWAFIAGVIGVISAAVGGLMGSPRELPASVAVHRE